MQTLFYLDPVMEAAVAKHRLAESTTMGEEVTFELEVEEVEFLEAQAKKYDCSMTVMVRAILECYMQDKKFRSMLS
jgi:hypothetical protein